jgi:hypothetical protein
MEIPDPLEPNLDILGGDHLTDEEKDLLARKVVRGSDVDPIPKIPDAPDVSGAPKSKTPGTYKNRIEGLTQLQPDELPVVGRHFVIWGSAHLDDVKARPVKRAYLITEEAHAAREVEHTKVLLNHGLKNPVEWTNPRTGAPGVDPSTPGAERWDRVRRTEHYARWRYRGYLAGEVASL